jgi:hypothetical protein
MPARSCRRARHVASDRAAISHRTQIQRTDVADHVLALGIHFPAVREHLGRHVRQRECEVSFQVIGQTTSAGCQARGASRAVRQEPRAALAGAPVLLRRNATEVRTAATTLRDLCTRARQDAEGIARNGFIPLSRTSRKNRN